MRAGPGGGRGCGGELRTSVGCSAFSPFVEILDLKETNRIASGHLHGRDLLRRGVLGEHNKRSARRGPPRLVCRVNRVLVSALAKRSCFADASEFGSDNTVYVHENQTHARQYLPQYSLLNRTTSESVSAPARELTHPCRECKSPREARRRVPTSGRERPRVSASPPRAAPHLGADPLALLQLQAVRCHLA